MENKNINSKKSLKNNVIRQMFDVRPVDRQGGLDMKKIESIGVTAQAAKIVPKAIESKKETIVYHLGKEARTEDVPVFYDGELMARAFYDNKRKRELALAQIKQSELDNLQAIEQAKLTVKKQQAEKEKQIRLEKKRMLAEKRKIAGRLFRTEIFTELNFKKYAISLASVAVVILAVFFGVNLTKKGISIKGTAMNSGKNAYANLALAKDSILNKDFQASQLNFDQAYDNFDSISKDLESLGGVLINATRYIPYLSKLSSGAALAQAGKDISQTGIYFSEVAKTMDALKNKSSEGEGLQSISMLKIFQDTNVNIEKIQVLLKDAEENLAKVNVDDIPEEQRAKFVEMKNKLPEINKYLSLFVDNSKIFTDVLGGNGPRKYLFLFQNNQEMRATGGFVGTYGVMNILNGRIDKFFIDGIFNPDGQLREKVVPPAPIQKISAAWSLHDSNWFPDFPASAEKATWFYEKTGGPTIDGVITMTPTVMQKLLKITGPIEMEEYGVTVDENNFLQEIQREVEVDYDKELNQPKKILADLAPRILDKIFNARSASEIAKTASVLLESLNEKQILIYSKNYDIEKTLSELRWSGEVLTAQKDYVSVINTNINGYKTDGMIEEKIEHQAEIQNDGSIIDTLTITRHHNGGNEEYEWLNKVNADYMRVYVPKGSQLVSVEGQTREFNSAPLDYDALGFKRDAQIKMEEDSMQVDDESGTRVYDDFDKTVFANWVYVSPQETVVVKYKYLLPFKIDLNSENKVIDNYSLLAQKQSGSIGSQFEAEVIFPEKYEIRWHYPDDILQDGSNLKLKTNLKTDKFVGVAFSDKQNKE